MTSHTITLELPESIYIRLQQAARATKQSLNDMILRAIQTGSPPSWDDVPAEFQADLAALDRLDDRSLWRIAGSRQTGADFVCYQALLDRNRNGTISDAERRELTELRIESDRLMIRKAHAAALLRWRGHQIPPADKFQVTG
ncbi:hypothetical protein [Desulfonema magnum]|uniref:Uncharacterized protein n=1 Tax=Desulfonema magnum TaxID=45655 RepID=A0A975BWD6_9BACT|nr:hypothetical protein [Desulfonema magnum]QTA92976.1 Uncharacterized protein dnm_090690 [Desulfonema magnum]